jgi:hypothetical protein
MEGLEGNIMKASAWLWLGVANLQVAAAAVVTTTEDSGPGSLRAAIEEAGAGEIITFALALSGATIRLTGGELRIEKSVMIDAADLPGGVTLSGDADGDGTASVGDSRVMKIEPGGHSVELRGLTITRGQAPATFLDEVGGGIFNDGGDLTLVDCTISSCNAKGIALFSSGGGIYSQSGTLTLTRCTLSTNESFFGGGLPQFGGELRIENSTLSGNAAAGENAGDGGAIYNLQGPVTIIHTTISDNEAEFGSGIFHADTVNSAMLSNSIVAGNRTAGGESDFRGSFAGTDNVIGGEPGLLVLGDYGGPTATMPPGSGSPAINAATGALLSLDQRGLGRPQGSGGDAGAVEVADTGYAPARIDLTYFGFDLETDEVVLRWKKLWPPYVIRSSADLSFGEAEDLEIAVTPANGMIDTTTWPGEIQFTFKDSSATGARHFWQVAGE